MKIGYARVSTEDQSLDMQLDALKAAGCDQVFQDKAMSGANANRPGLLAALDAIKEGAVLVTWRFDRLARSLHDLMDITSTLHLKSAGLHSLTENIDTSSSSGMLVLQIFGAVAEFERNLIVERTKAGLAAAKKRGVKIGRPRKLSDEDIAAAISWWNSGRTVDDVGNVFGVSRATLYRYLNTVLLA